MLKKLRVAVALVVIALLTFHFVDFAGLLPGYVNWLERIQFVPAYMAHAGVIMSGLVVLVLLLGRLYCSVICPLGIFQDVSAWFSKRFARKKKRYRYRKPHTALRWTVLGVFLVALFTGFSLMVSILDPYALYGRIASNIFYPFYVVGNNLLEGVFTSFNNYRFYRMDPSVLEGFSFGVAVASFLVVGFMAWKWGRLYCNTICPVGTVLGFLGRFSIFKVRINVSKCTSCGACSARCKAQCIDVADKKVDNSRCVTCYNCLGTCRFDALHYSSHTPQPKPVGEDITLITRGTGPEDSGGETPPETKADTPGSANPISRRTFIAASFASVFVLPKVLAQHPITFIEGAVSYKRDHPIMPPGAGDVAGFSSRCTACHLCVSKCPSRVLKPAFMEYGIGGIMQPVMFFEKGFCNFDCTVCGDVCPNNAIASLSVEEKHMTQVGRVVFIKDNCVVYRDDTSCGACSEHCPTQAVTMIPYKDGLTIPETDPAICVGCGGCEFICPVRPFRAIYVNGTPVQTHREEFHDERLDIRIDDFGF